MLTLSRRASPAVRVDLALLAVAAVWGSSYLAAKEIVTADGVFGFLTIRFGIASVGLAVLLAPRLRRVTRAELGLGALFGLILSVILTLETFGVTRTSATNAGLIIALTIVITPVLERCVRRRRLPPAFYGAAGLAVVGVAVLTQSAGFGVPGVGDVLILLAAVARAVHVIVMAQLSARASASRPLDSARVTLVQLCTALVVFALLSSFCGRGVGDVARHLGPRGWLLAGYLALACTVFAFAIQMWAVRRTSPTRVSLLLGTEPLWAAAAGMLVAGDAVTAVSIGGAILILLGTSRARTIDVQTADPQTATVSERASRGVPSRGSIRSCPPRESSRAG